MQVPQKITLCEVGLRDGLQNEAKLLTTEQKLTLARMAAEAGFPVIELGSFVNPKAVPQMADTDRLFRELSDVHGVELRALIANVKGVERAVACGCNKVKLNVSASRAHNLANLNMTPEQSVAGFARCVEEAKANGIAISGSISMPFASPWERVIPPEDVCAIVEAYLALGIREISISDASGMAVPTRVVQLTRLLRQRYPEGIWWMHFHNTRGVAMANILAAMQEGITRFDTSFGGLGGCPFVPGAAGNIASEDVLHMLAEMGVQTGIDLQQAMDMARQAIKWVGHSADSYLLRAGRSCELIRELPTGQLNNQTGLSNKAPTALEGMAGNQKDEREEPA